MKKTYRKWMLAKLAKLLLIFLMTIGGIFGSVCFFLEYDCEVWYFVFAISIILLSGAIFFIKVWHVTYRDYKRAIKKTMSYNEWIVLKTLRLTLSGTIVLAGITAIVMSFCTGDPQNKPWLIVVGFFAVLVGVFAIKEVLPKVYYDYLTS